MLSLQPIQHWQFLLEYGVAAILVSYDGSNWRREQREWNDATDHKNSTEDTFRLVFCTDVSIAYRRNCCHDEVEWGSEKLPVAVFLETARHPRSLVSWISFSVPASYKHPKAREDMTHHDERGDENEEALKAKRDLHGLFHLLENASTVSYNWCYANEFSQPHKLVQSTDSGNANHTVETCCLVCQQELEGENCESVNEEPRLQIGASYLTTVVL